MKYWLLAILQLSFFSLRAQVSEDSVMYLQGLHLMSKAIEAEQYLEVSRHFEDLAARNPSQWLTFYYSGLARIHASFGVKGLTEKDRLLDQAQKSIDQANKLQPGNSEILVLQAFLYQARLQVNPPIRSLVYSQKADDALQAALKINPENPRIYTLMGYNVYYKPSIIGGGSHNALKLFLKAQDKYQKFRPNEPFSPEWGMKQNQEMITRCRKAVSQ
jgi:tetratricopeptide (TPR) repeat protein